MIGIAALSLMSVVTAIIYSRLTKKISVQLTDYVVKNEVPINDLEITNSAFGVLDRMIGGKGPAY